MRLTQRGELTLQRHCLRDESLSGKGAGGRGGAGGPHVSSHHKSSPGAAPAWTFACEIHHLLPLAESVPGQDPGHAQNSSFIFQHEFNL